MAAKKKTVKHKKPACVYGLWQELVAPPDFIGAFSTRAAANAEMRKRQKAESKKSGPHFDYWVTRLCVK